MTKKITQDEFHAQQALLVKSEHDKQVLLFSWANDPKVLEALPELEWMYAVPNGGLRNIKVAMKLKAEGVKPGIFDVHLDTPRNGYSGLRIEMKHGYNKLTKDQKRWRDHWEIEGYKCAVCYSHLEAVEIIIKYLCK